MEAEWSDEPLIPEAEEAFENSSFGDNNNNNNNNNDSDSDPFAAWMSDDDDEIPESFEGRSLVLNNHSSGGLQSMDETLLQESLTR
jgi:hypothetical protein